MRLSEKEVEVLRYVLKDLPYKLYLFGSRIDDTKKGGDIDILIFAAMDETERFNLSRKISRDFFAKCEEKIDVVVLNTNNLSETEKAFLFLIKKELFSLPKVKANKVSFRPKGEILNGLVVLQDSSLHSE